MSHDHSNQASNQLRHHPEPEVLLQYASGRLSAALSIAVGLHQKRCRKCQQKIAELEALGGEAISVAGLSTESTSDLAVLTSESSFERNDFDALMADIAKHSGIQPTVGNTAEDSAVSAMTDFDPSLAVASDDLPIFNQIDQLKIGKKSWKRVTSKIWRTSFSIPDSKYQIELLKFAPNAKIPKHTHRGEEITQILQGAFSDSEGTYSAGDYLLRDQSTEHQPIAGQDGCICLAVTNAPLKFTGLLGPVLNFFMRA